MDNAGILGAMADRWKNGSLFLLMDLERTVGSGVAHYWKANRHGYTQDPTEAGLFDEPVAARLVEEDFDKRTVMISAAVVDKILRK